MIRRLIGLSMIVVIVMPIVLGALVVVNAQGLLTDLEGVFSPRVAVINDKLDRLNDSLAVVQGAADRISTSVSGFVDDVSTIASSIRSALTLNLRIPLPDIPDVTIRIPVINRNITIPLPNLPDLNLEIPGLRQVRDWLVDIFGFLERIGETLSDLAQVQAVAQTLGEIAKEATALSGEVGTVVVARTSSMVLLLVLFVVWVGLIYIVLVFRWLGEGWRMLTGRGAS
ncbi:MAG: hypothetical protein KC519_06670 [Anaerolineae bacterium]|nr:hypothetical protein [Anaerolineae bacterium]